DHPASAKPENKELFERASAAEEQVKTDQDQVNALKKKLAAAGPKEEDSVQEEVDVAQAQLELDQDELNDAKEDLVRSGADPGSLIQRQFAQHQAAEHTAGATQPPPIVNINYETGSFLTQFRNWRGLNEKLRQLERAQVEAKNSIPKLSKQHDDLEKQV